MNMAAKLSNDIDRMLEQYLQLLDQYTALRSQLTVAQASVSSSRFPISTLLLEYLILMQ